MLILDKVSKTPAFKVFYLQMFARQRSCCYLIYRLPGNTLRVCSRNRSKVRRRVRDNKPKHPDELG